MWNLEDALCESLLGVMEQPKYYDQRARHCIMA